VTVFSTRADEAELDVLVDALVNEYFDHLSWCTKRPCPHLGEAVEAILSWRRSRERRSIAAYLRAREDAAA
jgi:hypothetical protein